MNLKNLILLISPLISPISTICILSNELLVGFISIFNIKYKLNFNYIFIF